ncbi:MAG: TetR/AcrR family transcriptional regulator [Bdellovibrio sp.]
MARRKTEGRSDIILDSALKQFAQYGYGKSTIQDIAQASGVANGTVYLYYKSKEEILRACAERFHETHQEFSRVVLASEKSPSGKLRDYLCNRYLLWQKETNNSAAGSDLAQAMIHIAPEITEAEQALWLATLKAILKEGEKKELYHFESFSKELKIFLHCLIGFFPLPGASHPLSPTKQDLIETLEWFDKKWRTHATFKN